MIRRPLRGCLLVASLLGLIHCAEVPESRLQDAPREPVEAQASVDRAVATTGDLITYRIAVDAEASYEIEIPEAGAEIAGFRIVDIGTEEAPARNGRVLRERWYELRADLVGSYVLPPVVVGYRQPAPEGEEPEPWQTLTTSEIFVEVESVLPAEGGAEDIRGLKPLHPVRSPVPWVGIIAGLITALLIAAGIWWYLRWRAKQRDAVPLRPPHEVAFEALNALRDTDFDDPAAVRWFYFQISEILRVYVEGRFAINATDLTTEEILPSLASLEDLTSEQGEHLRHFLVDTDQVKFAHREPSRSDVESIYEQALSFIEATRRSDETAADEASLQEAA
jgi:hypothetical protein